MAEGGPFMETFDATRARVSQAAIASRLATGPRDESGRFRVSRGMSSLSVPEDDTLPAAEKGVRLTDPTKAVSLNVDKRPAGDRPSSETSKRARGVHHPRDGGDDDAAAADPVDDANPPKRRRPDRWVVPGTVVKIVGDKSLRARGLHKAKAVPTGEWTEDDKARVRILGGDEDGAVVAVAERHLETVLPAVGKPVRVVRGERVGHVGELRKIHQARFLAEVAFDAADGVRQTVAFLGYDDVCKVHRATTDDDGR